MASALDLLNYELSNDGPVTAGGDSCVGVLAALQDISLRGDLRWLRPKRSVVRRAPNDGPVTAGGFTGIQVASA